MNKLRAMSIIVLLAVFGVIFTITGVSDMIKLGGYVPDFNYDSIQEIKKGDFVQGYIGNIVDCYASETTTEKTLGVETSSKKSGEYFIMPLMNDEDVEKDLYITVTGKNEEDRKNLNLICDITWEYIEGNYDVEWIDMPIVAKAKPLSSELKGYMRDWFRETEWFDYDGPASDFEIEQHIVPYELVIYRVGTEKTFFIAGVIMLAIAAAAAVVFIIMVRRSETVYPTAATYEGYTTPQSVSQLSYNNDAELSAESSKPIGAVLLENDTEESDAPEEPAPFSEQAPEDTSDDNTDGFTL